MMMSGCSYYNGNVDLDKKLSDEKREEYILSWLEKKYNKEFTMEFLEEDELEVNCNEKGMCEAIKGASIYTYECTDSNGIVFQVSYSDPYIYGDNEEKFESEVVSYYDDVVKFINDNQKLITEYEGMIRKYTTVYKKIYKTGYEHFNYYDEDIPDNFGYVYFILCNDAKAAKYLYKEVNLHRRHIEQGNGSKMTVEFYFMKEWGLYNAINVTEGMKDPGGNGKTTLEKLTGLYEQVIGKDTEFNLRMYGGDTYNIKADHYYRNSFQYVAYYIKDGDFQVKGLKSSKEDVIPVVIEDYFYDENIDYVENIEET